MVQALGFIAATLTALAFLPQVLKVWRSQSTGDLSVGMLLSQSAGVALWIVYGVAIASMPIIVANTVTLTLTVLLLVLKWTYASEVSE
jgi:MtN3 and saliva related transmembrane protein